MKQLLQRSAALAIALYVLPFPDVAQWPTGNGRVHGIVRIEPALGGCMIGRLSDISYVEDGDSPEEKAVSAATDLAAIYFDVKVASAVFDGPDSYNALASPEKLIGNVYKDGVVLIGRILLNNQAQKLGSEWRAGVAMIVAHEVSHLRQYKNNADISVLRRELHADYLSGWIIGEFFKRGDFTVASIDAAERSLRNNSSGDYTNASFHGTADQRVAALRAGYDESISSTEGWDKPYKKGLIFVDTI